MEAASLTHMDCDCVCERERGGGGGGGRAGSRSLQKEAHKPLHNGQKKVSAAGVKVLETAFLEVS